MAISIKCRDIIGCRWHRGSWLIHNHHDGNLGLTLNLPASWMWSATPGPHWWRSRTSAALQARVIVETVKPVPAPSQDILRQESQVLNLVCRVSDCWIDSGRSLWESESALVTSQWQGFNGYHNWPRAFDSDYCLRAFDSDLRGIQQRRPLESITNRSIQVAHANEETQKNRKNLKFPLYFNDLLNTLSTLWSQCLSFKQCLVIL